MTSARAWAGGGERLRNTATSTAIFKTLIALKTRNGIIISPHPRAKRSTIAAAKVVLEAAVAAMTTHKAQLFPDPRRKALHDRRFAVWQRLTAAMEPFWADLAKLGQP